MKLVSWLYTSMILAAASIVIFNNLGQALGLFGISLTVQESGHLFGSAFVLAFGYLLTKHVADPQSASGNGAKPL